MMGMTSRRVHQPHAPAITFRAIDVDEAERLDAEAKALADELTQAALQSMVTVRRTAHLGHVLLNRAERDAMELVIRACMRIADRPVL